MQITKTNTSYKPFCGQILSAFSKEPTGVAFLLGEELSNKAESDPLWAPLWLLWLVLTHYLPTLPCFLASDRLRFSSLMQLFHWDPGRRVIVRAAPGVTLSDCNSIISGLAMTIIPGAHCASPKLFHKLTCMYENLRLRKREDSLALKLLSADSFKAAWVCDFWVRDPKGGKAEIMLSFLKVIQFYIRPEI